MIHLKRSFLILMLLVFSMAAFAQTDTTVKSKPDTNKTNRAETTLTVKPVPVKKIPKPVVDSTVTTVDSAKPVTPDSAAIALADSLRQDSIRKATAAKPVAVVEKTDTSTYAAILDHPYLPWNKPPVYMLINERAPQSKDELFYLLTSIVLLLALIKFIFPKYFQNLFQLFFQTSFRQKQTKDQLLQDNLPSLLMNLLFVIIGGVFVQLLAQKNGWLPFIDPWMLLAYAIGILFVIYLFKYLFLRFSGWVFNSEDAAGTYIFLVFLINKITAVAMIPLLLLIAFSTGIVLKVAVTASLILLGVMLLYRYVVSLGTIRSILKVNALHFFLYLCAVEVLPILLIYKAVFNFVEKSF